MYSTQLAQAAYAQPASPIRTHRGTEVAAFEKVTSRLIATSQPNGSMAARATAIHENRQLWTLLASDAADPENILPAQLRAQILYLCEFTHLHSRQVLNGSADLAPLIEINTAVMRGLRGNEVQ